MQRTSRRQFLSNSAAGLAVLGGLCTRLHADPFGMPIGFQTFPIAKTFVADVDGTLKQLAALGYRSVEMCSPPGYKQQFGALAAISASDLRQRFGQAGMTCVSSHYQFAELKQSLSERIAYSKELGLTQMIISSFALPKTATLDDWRRASDEANKIGAEVQKAGMQLGFHNHGFELVELEGVLIFDELMRRFDPALVKMQCQVVNVVGAGLDPVAFITKYPGRFLSLHLGDRTADGKPAPVGKGVIDWKQIFAAMKASGMQNYYVEMDMDALRESYPYLHALRM